MTGFLTAFELKEKLAKKEISSFELVKAQYARIKKLDGKIKSYLHYDEDYALKTAKIADEKISRGEDGALLGLPIAVKDVICVKGQRCTCGSKILENFRPPYDATVTEKIKQAGGVIIGKTNMDEFAMGSSTENSGFYPTCNPWDLERVPGGSSGGSAAAVGGGLAPLALGSDTGGSIRQPAAFCGISGLKPTYGLVSRYGLVAFASSLDQIGPMARSVKDLALLLGVIAGHDKRDSTSVEFAPPDYLAELNKDYKGTRLGIPKEFFSQGLDERIKSRIEEAIEIYRGLGMETMEISLPTIKHALAAYYIIAPAEASSNLARFDGTRYGYRDMEAGDIVSMFKKTRRRGFGDEVKRRIMIGTYALSSGYFDAYYLKAQKARTLIKQDFERAFSQCDLILSPTTPILPFKIGEKTADPLAMYLTDIYTIGLNLAGLPGLVVPAGFVDHLPVGMQLIGPAFSEDKLLGLGDLFQQNTDFHLKNPVIP